MSELVFEVVQEADGGYCAECLTENIFTQGDSWDELRTKVVEATAAYFFDTLRPEHPARRFGCHLADVLCRRWRYATVHQVGSHIILETEDPRHQRISIPHHVPLRRNI